MQRDLAARFTGSALGLFWAFLQPLTLVAIYWFVFSYMVRLGGGAHYPEFLVAGLLPWLAISEGVMRSTTALLDNAPLVRKLPLNARLLVLVPNVSAMVFQCVGTAIFVAFLIVRGNAPRAIWLLPLALALQFALQAGLGLVLAVAHVFFRDVTHVVGFVLSVVFYLSPILYPATGRFEAIFAWNPLTPLLGLYRRALLAGIPGEAALTSIPPFASFVLLTSAAAGALAVGSSVLRRTQSDLVDLI